MDEVVRENKEDEAAPAATTPQPRPYDFRRPYKAQVRRPSSLEPLHATFASKLAAALSEHLRLNVTVALAQVEQLRYEEFLYSIGPVTCLSVLRVDPPGVQAILDLGLPVIHPMIVRLLGGTPQPASPVPHSALTEIEKSLALQIVERAAAQLANTWSGAAGGGGGGGGMPITVREESLDDDPATVRIMPADELVTALRFDVRLASGGAGGTMSLCLSDPILTELDPSTSASAATANDTEAQRQDLHKNILDAAVELRALLAETHVRLSDVIDMQPGDVITTDKPATDEVQVQVEGKDKLAGHAAQLHGNRVVQITRSPRLDDVIDPPPANTSRSGDPS